jgi:hypothetical protein
METETQTPNAGEPAKVTSHLTTIIGRLKHRLEVAGGDPKKAGNDSFFRQSVRNLMEYQQAWTDFTKEEQKEADELYAKYSPYCKGT